MLRTKKTQTDRLPPIVSALHNESVQLLATIATIATIGQDDNFPITAAATAVMYPEQS